MLFCQRCVDLFFSFHEGGKSNLDLSVLQRDVDYTSLLEDRDFDAAYDAHMKVKHDACPLCQLF